jgi:hypothetical protein
MKAPSEVTVVRWLCVLPAVGLSFVASLFLSFPMELCVYGLFSRCGLVSPGETYLQFDFPWDGALAALLFVISGAAVAPGYHRVVALVLFVLGALISIPFIEQFRGPLHGAGPIFFGRTVAGTFAGGALAVACVFFVTRRSSSARTS